MPGISAEDPVRHCGFCRSVMVSLTWKLETKDKDTQIEKFTFFFFIKKDNKQ